MSVNLSLIVLKLRFYKNIPPNKSAFARCCAQLALLNLTEFELFDLFLWLAIAIFTPL